MGICRFEIFSTIDPTGAVGAALGVLANELAAKTAPNLSFDDVIACQPAVRFGDEEEGQSDEEEADKLVQEMAPRPD